MSQRTLVLSCRSTTPQTPFTNDARKNKCSPTVNRKEAPRVDLSPLPSLSYYLTIFDQFNL